jgi:hypothetical protein
MAAVKMPKKTHDRILVGLKRYQPIVRKLRERDISEADTVTVIKDILTDLFGYDKYTELTSEQQIRGTFCDLAIGIGGKIHYLAEVKSAGTTLNDNHLRQAVNYGANQGIEWVILSNAIEWRVYRIKFAQPIDYVEVFSFDLTEVSSRSADDLAKLFMLCRESISTDALTEYHRQAQIFNRFVIAELVQSEVVVNSIRREFRRLFPSVKATEDDIKVILTNGVLKRDTIDGDPPKDAKTIVKKATSALAKRVAKMKE